MMRSGSGTHRPSELGDLVATHDPIPPAAGLCICSAPGLVIGAGLAFGPVGSMLLGAFAYALTTALLIGLFSESLFVRQQLYEHGLLLSSVVPLTPRYAIPYATIDPDSIAPAPYRRPKGASDVTDSFNRRYRQAPMVATVRLHAVAPRIARALAKQTVDWTSTVAAATDAPTHVRHRSSDHDEWYVSFRDHHAAAGRLREWVRRDALERGV